MNKKLLFMVAGCSIFSLTLKAGGVPPGVAKLKPKANGTPSQINRNSKEKLTAPKLSFFIKKYTQDLKKGTLQYTVALKKAHADFEKALADFKAEYKKHLSASKPSTPGKKPLLQKLTPAVKTGPNGKPASDANGVLLKNQKENSPLPQQQPVNNKQSK